MNISTRGSLVEVSGDCTISTVKKLQNNLLTFVEMFPHIELDLSGVTEADYPFIQMLHLMHQKMISMKKVLTVLSMSDVVKSTVKRTGFCTKEQCDTLQEKCQIHRIVYWGEK
jgi:anti-anti-sigma regulatory factor